jgi:ribosomal protein S27E
MSGDAAPAYVRHKPEQTLLHQLVEQYWPEFQTQLSESGRFLPRHVTREFEDYLACGRLEEGFLRVRCKGCSHERLVAFSCKRRGFCTSCGARRMVETAAFLVDHVLPHRPIHQWVLSFPYPLRFVLANHQQVMGKVLAIVNRAISTHLINKTDFEVSQAHTGAVTLIQRFGSALNLHFHVLFIDGVFSPGGNGQLRFHRVNAPTSKELNALVATISERVARYLERQGWLARDEQGDHLALALDEGDEDTLQQLQYPSDHPRLFSCLANRWRRRACSRATSR